MDTAAATKEIPTRRSSLSAISVSSSSVTSAISRSGSSAAANMTTTTPAHAPAPSSTTATTTRSARKMAAKMIPHPHAWRRNKTNSSSGVASSTGGSKSSSRQAKLLLSPLSRSGGTEGAEGGDASPEDELVARLQQCQQSSLPAHSMISKQDSFDYEDEGSSIASSTLRSVDTASSSHHGHSAPSWSLSGASSSSISQQQQHGQQQQGSMSSSSSPARPPAQIISHHHPRMMENINSAKRLVEYFVVVSSKQLQQPKKQQQEQQGPLGGITNTSFHPVITARYPPIDHEENPLNHMVTHFCHPTAPTANPIVGTETAPLSTCWGGGGGNNGNTTTTTATTISSIDENNNCCTGSSIGGSNSFDLLNNHNEQQQQQQQNDDNNSSSNGGGIIMTNEVIVPQLDYVMPKIHHFVLTNSIGTKNYGTCLTVWEPYELNDCKTTKKKKKKDETMLKKSKEELENISSSMTETTATTTITRKKKKKKSKKEKIKKKAKDLFRKNGDNNDSKIDGTNNKGRERSLGNKVPGMATTAASSDNNKIGHDEGCNVQSWSAISTPVRASRCGTHNDAPSSSASRMSFRRSFHAIHSGMSPPPLITDRPFDESPVLGRTNSSRSDSHILITSINDRDSTGGSGRKQPKMIHQRSFSDSNIEMKHTISYEDHLGLGENNYGEVGTPMMLPRIEITMSSTAGNSIGNVGGSKSVVDGSDDGDYSDDSGSGSEDEDDDEEEKSVAWYSDDKLSSPPKLSDGTKTSGRRSQNLTQEVPGEPLSYEEDSEDDDDLEGKGRCYYLPRCLCILSSWPFLTAFREYLTQLYKLYFSSAPALLADDPDSPGGSSSSAKRERILSTMLMVAPLERYIINLCCEIPAPPPGVFEVRAKIFDSVVRFWSPPGNQPVAYVALPFGHLFSCLNVDSVLKVWHALALERQILLVSSQLSILTVCAEILLALLFPMSWTNLYIPVVPRFLTAMLDAPMPYLCGCSRANYILARERGDISRECIVVNLDENTVVHGPLTPPLPIIPPRRRAKLLKVMGLNASHVFKEARCLPEDVVSTVVANDPNLRRKADTAWKERLAHFDEAFNLAFTPDSPNLLNESGGSLDGDKESRQSAWDAVQEAFLRFYVSILRDYRKFLIVPEKDDATSTRGFQTHQFLNSSRSEYTPFLTELCSTQQFDAFLTKRLYDVGDADVTFFDQSIDAKNNRSKLKLKKVDTPFLHAAQVHKRLKAIIAVSPCTEDLPKNWMYLIRNDSGKFMKAEATKRQFDKHKRLTNQRWPDTFDSDLYYTPRPRPARVEAEFDRQGEMSDRLRREFIQFDKSYMPNSDASPEVCTFTIFFTAFSAVIGRELITFAVPSSCDASELSVKDVPKSIRLNLELNLKEAAIITSTTVNSSSHHNRLDSIATSQVEEAREIWQAQLSLAFSALQIMQGRKIHADLDAYKCLIDACGRCGDTTRAMQLVIMVHDEGLATDNVMYSCLMNAFSVQSSTSAKNGVIPQKRRSSQPWASRGREGSIDWHSIKKRTGAKAKHRIKSTLRYSPNPDFFLTDSENKFDDAESVGSTRTSPLFRGGKGTAHSRSSSSTTTQKDGKTFMSDLYSAASSLVDSNKSHKYRKTYKSSLVTDAVLKQVTLGESLLEFLYPGLAIDTRSETCPQCSQKLSEGDIVQGWKACDSQDYTTTCPHCTRRFVARFVVDCSSPTFVGSNGEGTPLKCEFLSPWVVLKEIRSLIFESGGLHSILNPEWRSGRDINASLWWNLIVSFVRYRIPISFLLQGSFQNRLITPTPDTP